MIEQVLGRGFIIIFGSIYCALILTIIPMGDWLNYFRPNWILLVVLFWAQVAPSRFGLWHGLIIGLLLDLLLDKTFGFHSLGLVFILFLQLLLRRQLRVLRGIQQVLSIIVFSFLYLLTLRILEEFFGNSLETGFAYWLPILSNAVIWPWFYIFMEGLKSRAGIYEANN